MPTVDGSHIFLRYKQAARPDRVSSLVHAVNSRGISNILIKILVFRNYDTELRVAFYYLKPYSQPQRKSAYRSLPIREKAPIIIIPI